MTRFKITLAICIITWSVVAVMAYRAVAECDRHLEQDARV